jgi:hypothetical protein
MAAKRARSSMKPRRQVWQAVGPPAKCFPILLADYAGALFSLAQALPDGFSRGPNRDDRIAPALRRTNHKQKKPGDVTTAGPRRSGLTLY